jgi:quercetin dioxygenase-like cupin family protein
MPGGGGARRSPGAPRIRISLHSNCNECIVVAGGLDMTQPQPFVVKPSEHRPLHVVGENIAVLASADSTHSYEVFLQSGPAGAGPPPHQHPWDEAYYVLDGQLEVLVGDRVLSLSAGEFVHVPAGTVHNFRMKSATAKFLSVNSGRGASAFFTDLDREVGTNLDLGKMLAIADRHQVQVPPPPAP